VAAGLDGDAQLGADAVGRRDQDRIAIAGFGEIEQAAEAADPADCAAPRGRFGQRRDPFDQPVAGRDVDSGLPVSVCGVSIFGVSICSDDGGFPGFDFSLGLGGLAGPDQSRFSIPLSGNPVFQVRRR